MKVIGITGGIGSGKSTAARFLAELGAVVVDVDKVGHEALKPGGEGWERVVNEFGRSIVTASGEIDRGRLGRLIFDNNEARLRLNNIMHPIIFRMVDARLEEYRQRGTNVVVLEAPLMLDVGRSSQADEVWVTIAPEATVLKRLKERPGLSEEQAKSRIRTQLPNEERIKHADVVIDTDCSFDELKKRVTELWQKLQAQDAG